MTSIRRSSLRLVASSALLAISSIVVVAVASGQKHAVSELSSELSASDEQLKGADGPLRSKISYFMYKNRWQHGNQDHRNHHHHSVDNNDVNDINDEFTSDTSSSSSFMNDNQLRQQQQQQQQQQQYTCGRALANKRLTNALLGDQHQTSASVRTKYRPFEIRMPRIIGGDETSPGEFPWTVSVKLNGQPICGGSLIDNNWILTAAHCVVGYNPKNLTVRLGAYRIKDTSETQTIDSALSLFIVHKQYSMPRPFSNDIALLKMQGPIKFSDFIIPICLPNADQQAVSPATSTSTSDLVLNDFKLGMNKLHTEPHQSGGSEGQRFDYEESGGIVVSTKMSDKEISRCFKRLEQNYLNSIGLGVPGSSAAELPDAELPPSAQATMTASATSDSSTAQDKQQNNQHNAIPPMPVDLLPTIGDSSAPSKLHQQTSLLDSSFALASPSSSLSFSSNLEPMFLANDDGYNQENQHSHTMHATTNTQATHDNNNNNNKITFPSFSSDIHQSDSNNAIDHQVSTITNNQHQSQRNRLVNYQHQHQAPNSNSNSNNYAHYGLPWSQRKMHAAERQQQQQMMSNGDHDVAMREPAVASPSGRADENLNGNSIMNLNHDQHQHQKAPIKLTNLPISKELLREIQSVGSMQSLNLGLQQVDIVAMASDLADSGSAGAGSPSGPPTGNAATLALSANNRERVVTTSGGYSPSSGTRQIIRNTDTTNELGDGSADYLPAGSNRYSGVSGIVVGWGWVRENDNDEQVGGGGGGGTTNKGFQSVTLQKVRLPILRNNDCEAWFRSQEKKITLLPSQFCAGFNLGGKDACRGDSGGPMIIEDNSESGRYKLIGIVSAGIGCARPSLPGLYTRVESFLPWINAQIARY